MNNYNETSKKLYFNRIFKENNFKSTWKIFNKVIENLGVQSFY